MRVEISKYIVADSEICHGKPTFKGTRIIVSDIVELIAAGESIEKITKSYRGLTKEMVKEVTGLIRGNGFEPRIKPFSFAASVVADRYT